MFFLQFNIYCFSVIGEPPRLKNELHITSTKTTCELPQDQSQNSCAVQNREDLLRDLFMTQILDEENE